MDFQRTLLVVALSLIIFMFWQTWEVQHNPVISKIKAETSQNSPPAADKAAGNNQVLEDSDNIPQEQIILSHELVQNAEDLIKISTDVLYVEIDKNGGKIVKLELQKYPYDIDNINKRFSLLQSVTRPFYIAENGVIGIKGEDKRNFPNHNARFVSENNNFELIGDRIEIPLVWQNSPKGLTITKKYIFSKNSYQIKLVHQINNQTQNTWKGSVYGQLQRQGLLESEERGLTNYSYTGAALHTEKDSYQKLSFSDLAEKNLNITANKAWIGFIQHYFTGVVIPTSQSQLYSYRNNKNYVVGSRMELLKVLPNQQKQLEFSYYLGPKLQGQMEQAAEKLRLTVDYGWLSIIGEPIFWLLKKIHEYVNNWGLAIILVTVLIKLLFFKLSATSYKSMARMRKLQPRVATMKERFGDDKQKMQQTMMKLYKEEKVNPMGGCLPILVQMPVFIALYWVLLESVELRQASFLWLNDLSVKDPYFILPIVMGGSMLIQQRLNPTPPDPIQAKIMMALPLVFTVFFAFFPSGLVLYWTVNNVLSITQQWIITKKHGEPVKK